MSNTYPRRQDLISSRRRAAAAAERTARKLRAEAGRHQLKAVHHQHQAEAAVAKAIEAEHVAIACRLLPVTEHGSARMRAQADRLCNWSWTLEQDQTLVEGLAKGRSIDDVARVLGMPTSAATARIGALGLAYRVPA